MDDELFDSTIPFGEPELMKATAYRRYLDELDAESHQGLTPSRLNDLSPSLQADLLRFEAHGGVSEAVEVMAACVRHSTRVTVHLRCGDRVLPLTVFPNERLLHCPMPLADLVERHLPHLQVMNLERAVLRAPGDRERALIGEPQHYHLLAPFLWLLALHGPRRELLPEIKGPAVYRVAPGLELGALPTTETERVAIARLRRQAVPLSQLAQWPTLDRERAARLLNALYLQAGLIISRSHPDAVRESWFGGL